MGWEGDGGRGGGGPGTAEGPDGGHGAKPFAAEGFFLNLRYEKPLSCLKQPLTKYYLLCVL